MTETWYVLVDGSAADPREVVRDAAGILRHQDGRAVATRPDGVTPRSRSVDVPGRQMQADRPGLGYLTRESGADKPTDVAGSSGRRPRGGSRGGHHTKGE